MLKPEKIGLLFLGVIALVAFIGLVRVDSDTGMFINVARVIMSGGIFDQDGNYLYTNKQARYQNLFSSIVAFAPDGRIVGSGQVWPGQYQLTLYSDWRNDEVLLFQVGFYDAARPERNILNDCAAVPVSDLLSKPGLRKGSIQLDLYCDMATFQKTTTMQYR